MSIIYIRLSQSKFMRFRRVLIDVGEIGKIVERREDIRSIRRVRRGREVGVEEKLRMENMMIGVKVDCCKLWKRIWRWEVFQF